MSELKAVARIHDVDRDGHQRRGGRDGLRTVAAHQDMSQQDPPDVGIGSQAAHVVGIQVVRAGRHGVGPVRRLGQERVARPDERPQIVGPAAVARVDEPWAVNS